MAKRKYDYPDVLGIGRGCNLCRTKDTDLALTRRKLRIATDTLREGARDNGLFKSACAETLAAISAAGRKARKGKR